MLGLYGCNNIGSKTLFNSFYGGRFGRSRTGLLVEFLQSTSRGEWPGNKEI